MPYSEQSKSLQYVQKFGPQLEKSVREALAWPTGRIIYYRDQSSDTIYDLEIDACYPNISTPETFMSVTYCKPDKPGHSNENKLQLKLGELLLLKANYPQIRSVLIIGGNQESWLAYVLEAFQFFFDKVIFAWATDFANEIESLKKTPANVPIKHEETWAQIANEWKQTKLLTTQPINSALRKNMWLQMKAIGCQGDLPSNISNEIFRFCMQAAYERHKETRGRNGKEWTNYANNNWDKIWQSRSFFNPGEAAIELLLRHSKVGYSGGLAIDEDVPSLIHHLGGTNVDKTKVSEDFILFSKALNKPIFIQSKSTGGGLKGHGKNIQNRTKEQLARSLFYRGYIQSGEIKLRDKDYIWIGVIDGNWGVTQKTPLKYIHMLQWAGYDYLIGADTLVDERLTLIISETNPLLEVLNNLDCIDNANDFQDAWGKWRASRFYK